MRTPVMVVFCACFAASGLYGQEFEPRMGKLVTKAAVSLRARPDPNAPVIAQIPAKSSLLWVDGQRSGSFLRALPVKGTMGWVPSDQVRIVQQPPTAPNLAESTSPPCFSTLSACPAAGCAAAGSSHAVFNKAKRRMPPASAEAVTIDFSDLQKLQQQADSLVGSGHDLTAADRKQLKNLTVAAGNVDEGSLVRVTGFLATGPLKPHPNTGESVNCRLKKPADNDFHISLVPDVDGTEFDGVVVEMIPQKRNPAWTVAKLGDVQQNRQRVLVTGALFYDNEHTVNDDPNNEVPGQPRRLSLWEVHPITEFLVCEKADASCDPDTPGDWTAVPVIQ